MKNVLTVSALCVFLVGVALAPAQAQYGGYGQPQGWHGVLSANDQSQFDQYYANWVDATRKNDQADVSSNARRMEEIRTRYNIPTNVPFDQVASAGVTGTYPAGGAYQGSYPGYAQARLSPDDQKQFDKYYAKWVDARRKNDQDDINSNANKMLEIMARYNIPSNVPFDQVASNSGAYPAAAYPNAAPQGPYPVYGQRLSPDDQKQFDKYYSKWMDATRRNDRDDIDNNARKMQEIMARYNIPSNVPFSQVASGGYASNSNPAYGYPAYGQNRLSPSDQRNFDKHYKKWVEARRRNDRDDIDNNARVMQDLMARYNIPANVPFDQIASPGAANH
jgi:hypothetical protein